MSHTTTPSNKFPNTNIGTPMSHKINTALSAPTHSHLSVEKLKILNIENAPSSSQNAVQMCI